MLRSLALLLPFLFVGCGWQTGPKGGPGGTDTTVSLPEARRGHQTQLTRREGGAGDEVEPPPAELFRLVRYPSPVGDLAAYLTPPAGDGQKRPAIVWLFGGFSNSIGATAWRPAPARNDQSASAFRRAGMVMMYPSLRGGAGNPGVKECCYGEVDDVIAAAEYLAKQEHVDPKRIYLGGHSTGGTLALLVAASTDRFRAVFSFGPVEDVRGYPPDHLPFNVRDEQEGRLRAPIHWLHSVRCPVHVIEGAEGNVESLQALQRASRNPLLRFHQVAGADHFNLLGPLTRLIADKVRLDTGAGLSFSDAELAAAMR